jgi:hypothetical protein
MESLQVRESQALTFGSCWNETVQDSTWTTVKRIQKEKKSNSFKETAAMHVWNMGRAQLTLGQLIL